MKTFVVLYSDGTMSFWFNRMKKSDFQNGAKLFSIEGDVQVSILPEWASIGFQKLEKIITEEWKKE
ncbi:hypothetical protein LCGC14_1459080 [marine sediment metagenome]|uniref:Uncharacterized protein n=1 Tax=marine sediment metagenome TaxID=412755 RepID=A0A0F9MHL7_9ZZZZ